MDIAKVVSWDWKGSPDVEEFNKVCEKIEHPVFNNYDSGSDSYVWIISNRKLSEQEMSSIYKLHVRG